MYRYTQVHSHKTRQKAGVENSLLLKNLPIKFFSVPHSHGNISSLSYFIPRESMVLKSDSRGLPRHVKRTCPKISPWHNYLSDQCSHHQSNFFGGSALHLAENWPLKCETQDISFVHVEEDGGDQEPGASLEQRMLTLDIRMAFPDQSKTKKKEMAKRK